MKFKNILYVVLFVPVTAFAGWSYPLTVKDIYIYGEKDWVNVVTEGSNPSSPSGCSDNAWQIVASSEEQRNRIYSALLSAQVSGKSIKLWEMDSCGVYDYRKANVLRLLSD